MPGLHARLAFSSAAMLAAAGQIWGLARSSGSHESSSSSSRRRRRFWESYKWRTFLELICSRRGSALCFCFPIVNHKEGETGVAAARPTVNFFPLGFLFRLRVTGPPSLARTCDVDVASLELHETRQCCECYFPDRCAFGDFTIQCPSTN